MHTKNIEEAIFYAGLSNCLDMNYLDTPYKEVVRFKEFCGYLDKKIVALESTAPEEILKFKPLDDLLNTIESYKGRCVLASSYHGHPIILLILLSKKTKIALLYEDMSESYSKTLSNLGAILIQVSRGGSANSMHNAVKEAKRLIGEGYCLATMFDAPHSMGTAVSFLGYRIRSAYLYSIIAYRLRIPIIPIVSWFDDQKLMYLIGEEIDIAKFSRFEDFRDMAAKQTFSLLEGIVLKNPSQYKWNRGCILQQSNEFVIRLMEYMEKPNI